MPIRALLLLDTAPLRRRMRKLIGDPHALVVSARKGKDPWSEISRHVFDLLFVEDATIRGPARDVLGTLRGLPDGPEAVVFSRRDDPERRGAHLAAGAWAVICRGLEDGALSGALSTPLARRREQAQRRFQAARAGMEPRSLHEKMKRLGLRKEDFRLHQEDARAR